MNRPILLTGASGFVGSRIARQLIEAGHEVHGLGHSNEPLESLKKGLRSWQQSDLADSGQVKRLLSELRPAVIIHAAAISKPVICEASEALAIRANVDSSRNLLEACGESELDPLFIYTSTDLVFEACKTAPAAGFTESDDTRASSVYGRTKLEAEKLILSSSLSRKISLRISLVYGESQGQLGGFSKWLAEAWIKGSGLSLFRDEWRTPTYVGDIARFCEYLLKHPELLSEMEQEDSGCILHLAGPEHFNREELGLLVARVWGFHSSLIQGKLRSEEPSKPERPANTCLNTDKLKRLYPQPMTPAEAGFKGLKAFIQPLS